MSNNKNSQNKYSTQLPMIQPTIFPSETKTNWGPHLFVYISFFTAAVTIPVWPYDFIGEPNNSAIQDLFTFLEDFEIFNNVSVFTYGFFATAELMFGGAIGHYWSFGFLPNQDSHFYISGPFFGLYMFLANMGIYVYNEGNVETPLLDIYVGVCPALSFQQLINPESNDIEP
jgi:hypothetical protein